MEHPMTKDPRPAAVPSGNGHEGPAPSVHSGRRPGATDTRGRILSAARHVFSEYGYERGTIRAIAAEAKVDPALVMHYFGNKDDLLAAALALPGDPAPHIPLLFAGDRQRAGERVTRTFLELLEDPKLAPMIQGVVRCAASHERAADVMRGVITRQVLEPLTRALGVPHAEFRAALVASQFVGLAMTRYLTRIEPLASADVETVVRVVAPNVQRYLTGALDLPDETDRLERHETPVPLPAATVGRGGIPVCAEEPQQRMPTEFESGRLT
jgi:AcrR family transcriptional regulator